MPKPKQKKPFRTDDDRRIERVFERLFPELNKVGPRFARLVNEFDPMTPRTTIAKGKKLLDSYLKLDSVRGRFFVRLLKIGIRSRFFKEHLTTHLDDVIKIAKTEAERDSRYSLLLKLMHEVDQVEPLGSYVVVYRHADPEKCFLKQMDPLPDFEAARTCSGERRFNHAIEALRRTVEHLYDPYIKTLVYLSYLRDKKSAAEFSNIEGMNLGVAIDHLRTRLSDYSGLIDMRAAWFRNAITHEIPEYDRATDTLVLSDRSKSAALTTDELLEMAESSYQLSAKTVVFVSQLYLFRNVLRDTGFFDMCLEYVPRMALETEPGELKSIEEEFGKRIEEIFLENKNGGLKE